MIKNRDKILKNPKYYNIYILDSYIAGLNIGTYNLRLGDLLRLYKDTVVWNQEDYYIYSIIGSPFSGFNSCKVWNKKKKRLYKKITIRKYSFNEIAHSALSLLQPNITSKDIMNNDRSEISLEALIEKLR